MNASRYVFRNLIPGIAAVAVSLYCLIDLYYHVTSLTNPIHMKPSTYIAICVVAAVVMLSIVACSVSEYRPTTEYAVLIDQTDSTFTVPDTADVYSHLGLDTNIWAGVNFTLARIKDVSYVPHASIVLAKGGNRLSSNQYARKRQAAAFKAKLADLFDSVRREAPGKPNSSIYLPVVHELTRLANSNAERKVLVVYSDLLENTPSVSFYDAQTFALLQSDPGKVQERLFAHAQLPDLTGIHVHLIYEPKDAGDDAVFQVVSGFYKKLLEEKGAIVSISANLTNQ